MLPAELCPPAASKCPAEGSEAERGRFRYHYSTHCPPSGQGIPFAWRKTFFLLRNRQEGSPLMLKIFSLGLEASFSLTNPAETRQQCRLQKITQLACRQRYGTLSCVTVHRHWFPSYIYWGLSSSIPSDTPKQCTKFEVIFFIFLSRHGNGMPPPEAGSPKPAAGRRQS